MEEKIKEEAKARDEEQQRIKRQWHEDFEEQEMEKQKDEQKRRVRELKNQLEEDFQKAQTMDQNLSEMQVDEEDNEDYEWEEQRKRFKMEPRREPRIIVERFVICIC